MSASFARLRLAGRIFRALQVGSLEVKSASMQQLDDWDRLLTLAELRLAKHEFANRDLNAEFFGDDAPQIDAGLEAETQFYVIRKAIFAAAFARRAISIGELACKMRIWRRCISEDHSRSATGYPDEFLSWSIYKDVVALNRMIEGQAPMKLSA